MLQSLFYLIIVSVYCISWGLPVLLLGKERKAQTPTIKDWMLAFFAGLCILSIISSWICLIAPVQPWLLAALTLLLMITEGYWLLQSGLKWKLPAPPFTLHFSE